MATTVFPYQPLLADVHRTMDPRHNVLVHEWQEIGGGVTHPRFVPSLLTSMPLLRHTYQNCHCWH